MIAREPLITSGFIKKIALFNFEKGLGRPWGVDVLQTALQSGTGSGTGLVYNSMVPSSPSSWWGRSTGPIRNIAITTGFGGLVYSPYAVLSQKPLKPEMPKRVEHDGGSSA